MKNPLILLGLLALTAAGIPAAHAQDAPSPTTTAPTRPPASPAQQAERQAQQLANALGLSDEQRTKLQPILLAQRQEMIGVREKRSADGRVPGMGKELKAAQANYNEQIRAVLTPEQYTRFAQLKADRRDNMRAQRGARPTSVTD